MQVQIDHCNINVRDGREMARLGHGGGRANDEFGELPDHVQGNKALIKRRARPLRI
jgi:hypothetical protein